MMHGRLLLVPSTLDFGIAREPAANDIRHAIPDGVMQDAARLAHWVAEDARSARAFLKRVHAVMPLSRPLQEIHIIELPRPQKGARDAAAPPMASLLAPARDGHNVGLICEAGVPAVADPGALLVQAAHAEGIEVVALAGPSSLMLALAASGLNGQSFAFVGYLPVDAAQRATRIKELESISRRASQTQLMIETPYRNEAMLTALVSTLHADTRLSVSCGLTVPGGWTRSDRIATWRDKPRALPKDVPAVFCLLA